MTALNNFQNNLRELRKKKGLSQDALGELLNLSYMTIRRWEAGKATPSLIDLQKLCEIFHVSENELLNAPSNDTWTLEIKISNKEMIDMTQCGSISNLDLQKNYVALTLGGSYEMFEDDGKFEDFINQLRAARPVVIETGRKLRGIL